MTEYLCRPVHLVALAAACLLLVGCGGESVTDVQGNITYNGKPVTFGLINFKPATGQPLGGAIQPNGTYSFELPPGEYQVRIESPDPEMAGYKEGDPPPTPGKQPQGQVPPEFANYDTSGLTATIGTDSPQQLDFTLP